MPQKRDIFDEVGGGDIFDQIAPAKVQKPIRPLAPIEPPAESTIGSRAREAAIGALEPFALQNLVPSLVDTVKKAGNVVLHGDVQGAADLAKGLLTAPVKPVTNYIDALRSGDYDAAANASGGILSQTVPAVAGAAEAMKPPLKAAAGAYAPRLYESALKPAPRSNTFADVQQMVRTGLNERIPVSRAGVAKTNSLIDQINRQVEAEIATNPNAPISPNAVASRVDPTIGRFAYEDNPKSLAAASANKGAFVGRHSTPVEYSPYPPPFEPSLSFKPPTATYQMENAIPAVRAQAIKKGIWRELGDNKFGQLEPGYVESQKQIGRGLREEIGAKFPNVNPLNAREGNLIELRPELEAAANRAANRNILALDTPVVGAGVKAISGSTPAAAGAGFLKELVGAPAIKSRLAILLDRLSRP